MLRNGEQLLLAVVIPVIVLIGGVTRRRPARPRPIDHPAVDVFTPGVLALAVMSTAFTSLAIATGFERRYGVIKRLGSSPLPRSGLLAGKVGALLLVEVLQIARDLGGRRCSLGWDPAARRPRLGALLAVVARHRGVRRARAASSPACCAPRPRSPPPTWSTCCCSPAARSCCPRSAYGAFGHVAAVAALRRARRGDARRAPRRHRRLARPRSCCSSGPSSAPSLTARTFSWE